MNSNIAEFRLLAQRRWRYLEKGDSRNGNECFEKLRKLADELIKENRLEELSVLLKDPDDSVKFEAASKLLMLNSPEAEDVLANIAVKKGILPFTARQTLMQCKKQ